jgi:hypothetical protein
VIKFRFLGSSLLSPSLSVAFGSLAVVRRHEASLRLTVLLLAGRLGNISRQLFEKDFAFIVNGSRYLCPSCVAKFHPPPIS